MFVVELAVILLVDYELDSNITLLSSRLPKTYFFLFWVGSTNTVSWVEPWNKRTGDCSTNRAWNFGFL